MFIIEFKRMKFLMGVFTRRVVLLASRGTFVHVSVSIYSHSIDLYKRCGNSHKYNE